jgi:glycosyltransferase involved in cell wall biosynthesis
MDIIREYQKTHPRGKDIRIVRQPQNMGIGEARNRIVKEARGRYLYFLDGDDTIISNAIQLLYDASQSYNSQVVYGSHRRIEFLDGKEKETLYQYSAMQFSKMDDFASWVYRCYDGIQATTWNVLIDLAFLRSCNLQFEPISYWEDFTFMMLFPTYVTRVVLLPDITYTYYCRNHSLSNFQHRSQINKSEIEMVCNAVNNVKIQLSCYTDKCYYSLLFNKIMMTNFYAACAILRNKKIINPFFSDREIHKLLQFPFSFMQYMKSFGGLYSNIFLIILSKFPSVISVNLIKLLGKYKGLI